MTRRLAPLLIGALLAGIGTAVLAAMLAAPRRWALDVETLVMLVPAALVVVGALLAGFAVRGILDERRRRAMPLAAVRPAPAAATGGRWELSDVASELARRLADSPCAVHHARERVEVRWRGGSWGEERCELRDAGGGELEHADVIETASEMLRARGGSTVRVGPWSLSAAGAGAREELDTLERLAVHDALDETLGVAGWRLRR